MKSIYTNLESWFSQNLPELVQDFNSSASLESIKNLEKLVWQELPSEFHELYSWHDGQRKNIHTWPWYGLSFLTIEEVFRHWEVWHDLKDDSASMVDKYMTSTPKNCIKCNYKNHNWIPFWYDYGGNFLWIDLSPDTWGTRGQVINFWRDEDDKYVIASGIQEFVKWLYSELSAGNYNIQVEADGGRSFNTLNPLKYHFLDSVKIIFWNK